MEILYKVEDFIFEDKKQALQFEEIISNNKFYFKQKKEIYLGIINNLDVTIYAKEIYDADQMKQIRIGQIEDLDVTIYAYPKNSCIEMSKIRYLQLNRLKNF